MPRSKLMTSAIIDQQRTSIALAYGRMPQQIFSINSAFEIHFFQLQLHSIELNLIELNWTRQRAIIDQFCWKNYSVDH